MDTVSIKKRSEIMRCVKNQRTKPEMIVRRLLFSLGYRFRVNFRELPGKPDIVFTKKRKVIFVNGCFWHQHKSEGCLLSRLPKTKLDFWIPKLTRNAQRDAEKIDALNKLGWLSLVIWECELKNKDELTAKLTEFMVA